MSIAIDSVLSLLERGIPTRFGYRFYLYASRAFGLTVGAVLGIPMWTINAGACGWTIDGRREPLRYRLSCAMLIWRARYWYDWAEAYPEVLDGWGTR